MECRETDRVEMIQRIAVRVRKLIPLVAIAATLIVLGAAPMAASLAMGHPRRLYCGAVDHSGDYHLSSI